jgi:hypothetical protein
VWLVLLFSGVGLMDVGGGLIMWQIEITMPTKRALELVAVVLSQLVRLPVEQSICSMCCHAMVLFI